jgi:SpoVK/Ycf46/Vps4 family AAA+-type ATPase
VVIDEIDAVFRKRSSSEDSGEATRSSVVNQILSKLDGVNAIPNVLVIGLTNRRELLDDALLRPGRLEVQIEIPLPSKQGRREILNIQFAALRRNGRLSRPLRCAIDGVSTIRNPPAVPFHEKHGAAVLPDLKMAKSRPKRATLQAIQTLLRPTYDLAADSVTGGFSGADLAGLVRCAGSIALARLREQGASISNLVITLEDVKQALDEVKRGGYPS